MTTKQIAYLKGHRDKEAAPAGLSAGIGTRLLRTGYLEVAERLPNGEGGRVVISAKGRKALDTLGVWIPRGRPPKQYPQEVVDSVSGLYARGLTQREIAVELGISQKVVWNVMRRHSLRTRKAAKRNQRGSKNGSWKGSRASYAAFHKRVEAQRGTPAICLRCGASGPGRTYDWANLTGRYDDPADYERMCRSCHRLYDLHRL